MRRITAFLAALLVAACSNEIDTSTRPESVVGTYELHSYAGKSLPTQVSIDELGTTELLTGELVLEADRTWTEYRVYRYVENGVSQDLAFGSSGSWVMVSGNPEMQFNDKLLNYQFTGTAAGGSVTLYLNDGATVIYTRP